MAMIKLDRERALRYSIVAARKFKEAYGKPLWRVRTKAAGEPLPEIVDPDCLVAVLWAGLLAEDPKITIPTVERLLDAYIANGGDLRVVFDIIGEAFKQSGIFGKSDEDNEVPKAPTS